jgi:DNA/RNA-binding domain of Phe-tRNA-synthetase-like protein
VNLTTDPALAGIVKPGWFVAEPVTVVDRDPAMDEPLRAAAAAMRARAESAETTAAVRTMYKRVGIDPTKTRPSSEALLRRVRRGDELPRINSLVDVINWCSLENAIAVRPVRPGPHSGHVELRIGRDGEEYAASGRMRCTWPDG